MKNKILTVALALVFGSANSLVQAQSLYNPTRTSKDQGLALSSWGSGTISETDETAFEGTLSVRISSRNYFQGGIMTFATPVDLSQAYGDKNNLLNFTLHVPAASTSSGPGTGAGAGKGDSGPARGGGLSGGGGLDGGGEGNVRGGGGGTNTTKTLKMISDKSIETLRVVITTTDGLKSEAFVALKSKSADQRGWLKAGLPLQAVAGFGRTNKIVKSIALAGDASATFYVGEIGISNDSTDITAELNEGNLNLALGDEKTFIAGGYGGSTPLKFEWDFDDSDGIQVDATGQTVRRKFRKAGKFKVTLTVSDVYGLKKPSTTTIEVEVNP